MTRTELLQLPIAQLVNLVLENQMTIAQLRTRVAELEAELSGAQADLPGAPLEREPRSSFDEANLKPILPSLKEKGEPFSPVTSPANPPGPTSAPPSTDELSRRVHRHRHHRPWYKKMQRALLPRFRLSILHLLIAAAIILAAAAVGLAIAHWSVSPR